MNNEETRVLDPENENIQAQFNEDENYDRLFGEPKKSGVNPAVIAGAAVGAAVLGTGAGFAANHFLNPEELADGETEEEQILTTEADDTNANEHHHHHSEPEVREHYHHVVHEQPVVRVVAVETDKTSDSGSSSEGGEAEVLGVTLVDNGDGTYSVWAAVQAADGDQAIFVDANADGTINYVVHDDNGDGKYDEGEVYNVTSEGYQTAMFVDAVDSDRIHYASLSDSDNDAGMAQTAMHESDYNNDVFEVNAKSAEFAADQEMSEEIKSGEVLADPSENYEASVVSGEQELEVEYLGDVNSGEQEIEAEFVADTMEEYEGNVELLSESHVEPEVTVEPESSYEPVATYEPEPAPEPTYEPDVDYGTNDVADYSDYSGGDDFAV